MKEQVRVLKKAGYLIVDVPQKYNPYTLYKHRRMREGVWEYGWETEYSYSDLNKLARSLGLAIVDVGSYGYGHSQDYGFSRIPRAFSACAQRDKPVVSGISRIAVRLIRFLEQRWGHYFQQNIVVVMQKP
jgi:hypothetical protein